MIKYADGDQELVDRATLKMAKDALDDPNVDAVSLHKPGDIVTMRDGTRYIVTGDGSWGKLKDGAE